MKKIFFGIFILLAIQNSYAQTRPKIGLCLSGGGAKGLAHIGLLKVLDSSGIKIDYITGTSMGAIWGGMYSVGYKGKDLERIAKEANWNLLLSNNIPLTDINIEEKDEFGRYVAEFPIIGYKPSLPLGVIEGQGLTKLLSELTFPVHQITNFDSLPIPFRCIGADILTGEAVVLKEGYLPTAMRASMAIPSVFTPVKWKDRLLVDGGLVRNFPVTDLKEMGADIIIGGYTGGRLYTEEELNTALKLIYQSASFNRIADSEIQKSLCNILADYNQQLQAYSTSSFNNVDSIIAIGYRVALTILPTLQRLVDSLEMRGLTAENDLKKYTDKQVCISNITLDGANFESSGIIHGKLGLMAGETYTVTQLNDAIEKVYGTRFFDKVYYTLKPSLYGNELVIHVKESRRAVFKFGLHYDNEQAAGLLANLTLRNVLGPGSRILATLDIAEYPKVRVRYQKFINHAQNLWVNAGYQYEFVPYRLYSQGRLQEELGNSFNQFKIGVNKTLRHQNTVGIFGYSEINFTRTKIYPEDRANPDSFSFRYISNNEAGMGADYFSNSQNSFLFPTRGTKVYLQARYIPYHYYTTNYYAVGFPNNRFIDVGKTTSAFRFSASVQKISAINKNMAWINNFFGGVVINNDYKNRKHYTDEALPSLFLVGGIEQRQRTNTVPFIGFREGELIAPQVLAVSTALQTEVINNLYITPTFSFMATGQNLKTFVTNINEFNFLYQNYKTGVNHVFGYGISFAYNWFGGPISFTVYRATGIDVTRGYFTLGFKF